MNDGCLISKEEFEKFKEWEKLNPGFWYRFECGHCSIGTKITVTNDKGAEIDITDYESW